jgi:hypothetical protein
MNDPHVRQQHFIDECVPTRCARERAVVARRRDLEHSTLESQLELVASLVAHDTYWQAIGGQKDRPQAERDAEVIADVETLLWLRGDDPTVLAGAARQVETRNMAGPAQTINERILNEHPASAAAEWVFVNRYRAMEEAILDSPTKDPLARGKYQAAVWAFLRGSGDLG